MTDFVLVHGAWHGAWCFDRLVAQLEALGHRVTAIDLPSHGDDGAIPANVTFDDYVARTLTAVEAADDPVLVGHSMAGMVISGAAERAPTRIGKLVYLAAFLPQSGESLMAIEARNPAPVVPPASTLSTCGRTVAIDGEMAKAFFYSDCANDDAVAAAKRLSLQPAEPFLRPVELSAANYGSVPKAYIACDRDVTIPASMQADMVSRYEGIDTVTLPADHSPFLSQPDALARVLTHL